MQDSTGHSRFFAARSVAAILLIGTAIAACSGMGPSAGAVGDPSCAALTSCCGTVPGETTQSCQATVQAAQASSGATSCASVLQSYVRAGYCGGLDGGASGANGSAPAGNAGAADAASPQSPSQAQCQLIGSCPNGQTYETCMETSSAGACSASIVFSDGARMTCVSCSDCTAASQSASARCNGSEPPIVDAAPPPPDAAPPPPVDAGPSCGTTPVLHSEAAPGVYCPFTAAGGVHCAAGQQCCEAPAGGISTCAPAGTGCPLVGSLVWECADPLDCIGTGAGAACCATGGTTALDPTCSYYRGSGFTGSRCAPSCGAADTPICSAANDPCVSPKACTPFKVAGLVLGACL